MPEPIEIRPQPGPQETFLSTPADIAIYGGAAGGGKTFSLLMEPLRHVENPRFRGVIFRREGTDIGKPGGLWDQSNDIYPCVGGYATGSHSKKWVFPSGMAMSFHHLQYESDKQSWQGAQVPYFGFDELTHFTESQFFYMMSRNRSTSGVAGYMRAGCNPEPDSWVANLISGWIQQDENLPGYGLPIQDRAGIVRYFTRDGMHLKWGDSVDELVASGTPKEEIKSLTFVPSSIYDNKIFMEKDPTYIASLKALPYVDRVRLLDGNWKIRAVGGNMFKRHWFGIQEALEANCIWIRYWDRAASKEEMRKHQSENDSGPAYTVGCLMGKTPQGQYIVKDITRFRGTPLEVESAILSTASLDGRAVHIGIEQDPGQAGKFEAQYYVRKLAGYMVKCYPARDDKITRAKPLSAQAEVGNVKLLKAGWNMDYLNELQAFPDSKFKDQVDASSGAFNALAGMESNPYRIS